MRIVKYAIVGLGIQQGRVSGWSLARCDVGNGIDVSVHKQGSTRYFYLYTS